MYRPAIIFQSTDITISHNTGSVYSFLSMLVSSLIWVTIYKTFRRLEIGGFFKKIGCSIQQSIFGVHNFIVQIFFCKMKNHQTRQRQMEIATKVFFFNEIFKISLLVFFILFSLFFFKKTGILKAATNPLQRLVPSPVLPGQPGQSLFSLCNP